jgi:HPt (histidine-containing phosphotransfer) domain-containing protein
VTEARTLIVIDFGDLLCRVQNNLELRRQMLSVFHEEFPNLLQDLRNAVNSGDSGQIELTAHTLKGTLHTISAFDAQEAAARMEDLALLATSQDLQEALAILETKAVALSSEIGQWLNQN